MTTTPQKHPMFKYLNEENLPSIFCPGCGCGQIMDYMLYALDELEYDMNKVVMIGGVGCTSRIPAYIKSDGIHGAHGRTLAWASGIRLTNPELKIIILTGDGDLGAIGGNHFIQGARRNLDVTVIVNNNRAYGMTGGQMGPTTRIGDTLTTSPHGHVENEFDLCKLAEAAGATYVSRWTTAHPGPAIRAIKGAIEHKGFSLIEMMGQCITYYGRYALGIREPADHYKWLKENSVLKSKAADMPPEELVGKMIVGNFVKTTKPTLIDRYLEMEAAIRKKQSGE